MGGLLHFSNISIFFMIFKLILPNPLFTLMCSGSAKATYTEAERSLAGTCLLFL